MLKLLIKIVSFSSKHATVHSQILKPNIQEVNFDYVVILCYF